MPALNAVISPTARADAIARLRAGGCVFAEEEAAELVAVAADEATLAALVHRRVLGEPLEYTLGHADRFGIRTRLRPGVFVPRHRSDLLVRLATDAASARDASPAARPATHRPVVVDLCCGSGALGAAVAHRVPHIELHAADLDPVAVACARDNLAALNARVHEGDLFAALPARLRGHIDVLLANVPYVPTGHLHLLPAEARLHEPRTALDGGHDGLELFRRTVVDALDWLAPGGSLLCELTAAQAPAARAAMRIAGLLPELAVDDEREATAIIGKRPASDGPRSGELR